MNALQIPIRALFEKEKFVHMDCEDEEQTVSANKTMSLAKQRILRIYMELNISIVRIIAYPLTVSNR